MKPATADWPPTSLPAPANRRDLGPIIPVSGILLPNTAGRRAAIRQRARVLLRICRGEPPAQAAKHAGLGSSSSAPPPATSAFQREQDRRCVPRSIPATRAHASRVDPPEEPA